MHVNDCIPSAILAVFLLFSNFLVTTGIFVIFIWLCKRSNSETALLSTFRLADRHQDNQPARQFHARGSHKRSCPLLEFLASAPRKIFNRRSLRSRLTRRRHQSTPARVSPQRRRFRAYVRLWTSNRTSPDTRWGQLHLRKKEQGSPPNETRTTAPSWRLRKKVDLTVVRTTLSANSCLSC